MIRVVLAAAIAGSFTYPAVAQQSVSGERMLCSEYSALDNAGQMGVVAAVESAVSQMAVSQDLTSAEIHAGLVENCTAHPEMIVVDVVREYLIQ